MKKRTIKWFLFTHSKETAYGTGGGKNIVSNFRVRHHFGEKYENENLGWPNRIPAIGRPPRVTRCYQYAFRSCWDVPWGEENDWAKPNVTAIVACKDKGRQATVFLRWWKSFICRTALGPGTFRYNSSSCGVLVAHTLLFSEGVRWV